MAKDKFSRTKSCATKTLYAVMKEMSRRGGSMPAKELYPFVNENVALTDWEGTCRKDAVHPLDEQLSVLFHRLSEGRFYCKEEWQLVFDTRR